jgi:cell division protease FtsH
MWQNILTWIIITLVVVTLFSHFRNSGEEVRQAIEYSTFIDQVKNDQVSSVTIEGAKINGTLSSGASFKTYNPGDSGLIGDLLNHKVRIVAQEPEQPNFWLQLLISWFPMIFLVLLWLFVMRSMMGGGGSGGRGNPLSFGRSKAKMLSPDQVKTTFKDVAGVDEAKEEVTELVDFLRAPEKFQKLGGKIPRGVLMVGQPGTGKTLLAKAIAGEAKVPFFTISGSDFVEMFVGVGASRVRDMFTQAKAHSPCIIFIDEIDAVGRHRGAGMGGGNDEREQTLNQMLVEMDGFDGNEGIIVIAATNRPDVLDPALLRPGRFDRQVVVPLPDIKGREQILKVHMKNVPLHSGVKASVIARGTPGFSGADLANIVNEAALISARKNKKKVSMLEFDMAKDKIIMGVERKSMVMDDKEKKLTAYHEAGHAIIGYLVPEHDPVYKVSIIPRGRALGVTMYLPEQDRYSHSKQRLLSQLCSMYGGRIAEEMVFGAQGVTTGASNDIQRATQIARNMVMKWGLSDKLGPLLYEEDEDEVFIGKSVTRSKNISDGTMEKVDAEIHQIIEECYASAEKILKANEKKLHLMADALIKYETIEATQVKQIMEDEEITPPDGWKEDDSADDNDTLSFEGQTEDDIEEEEEEEEEAPEEKTPKKTKEKTKKAPWPDPKGGWQ